MPHIFLSHSADDSEFIHQLVDQIRSELPGVTIFASTEPDAIKSGDWFTSVLTNLDNSNIFIAVITPLSEKSIWVAFEYGYFWKQNGKDKIFILRHPKAKLFSPFNVFQSKDISNSEELRVFFKSLCESVGQTYLGKENLAYLLEIANKLPILSNDERKQQKDLIRQMGSPNNLTGLDAVRELRDMGWLTDGSLNGKAFSNANLQEANLSHADLQQAKLNWANLKEADLTEANLEGADLSGAHFEKASQIAKRAATLWYANLRNANLSSAILTEVNFGGSDLRGANLRGAYLVAATFDKATKFDTDTILPDGQLWTPSADMKKYKAPRI